jgi:hypothetical protein
MRKKTPFALLTVFAAALIAGAGGCKQDVGDRCEQNSDCSSGFCSVQSVGIGGRCCASAGCQSGGSTPDSGLPTVEAGSTAQSDGSEDVPQTTLDGASSD